ncbi:MAG: A/G-specific adenine glycosylase [Gemmatales bacterium]|nr:A/G-specific adenine glycosylase [Gemmatales bacterium]MDW8385976.1 A/G-specific adenine glycosylase [Gemmatales bacterium]
MSRRRPDPGITSHEPFTVDSGFHRALRAWFRQVRRPLPWRQSRDPYRIWVSEVMLQQTQVATVIPYFHRFLETFPTLSDLAAASEQDVLRAWEGLGYYRRARSLHRAARILARDHGGEIPHDAEALARLPGIGRYTLGAILSQAFDQRYPAVDANVARVLCRLAAWDKPLETSSTQRWLHATAETILPERKVGEFNQALMELGSLICKSSGPKCLLCPVRSWCRSAQRGLQELLPRKAKAKELHTVVEAAVVLRRRNRLLLVKRSENSVRWAGLWEFPHDGLRNGEDVPTALCRLVENDLGLRVSLGDHLGIITYGVTRFRYQMHVHVAKVVGGRLRLRNHGEARWMRQDQLADLPMPSPQRRVVRLLEETASQQRVQRSPKPSSPIQCRTCNGTTRNESCGNPDGRTTAWRRRWSSSARDRQAGRRRSMRLGPI